MDKLSNINVGNRVKVEHLTCQNLLKERLLALGLTKDSTVEIIRKGPCNNLTVYKIRGTMIALRKEESDLIFVSSY